MANLADWINQQFGLAPKPPMPVGFSARIPDSDADGGDEDDEILDESDLQGQSFLIEYRDSAGEISKRRITVRKLKRTSDGMLCLGAHCWERDASRSFRVDRIICCSRISDPEPIADANRFFEQYMHDGVDGAANALMKEVRPGLRVLLYLARCDGNVHPEETVVMRSYVSAYASGPVNWTYFEGFIESQHPDKTLARSMLKVALAERARAARLLTAAKRLIDADGIVAPEEVVALEKMLNFSEGLRYQEDIRYK